MGIFRTLWLLLPQRVRTLPADLAAAVIVVGLTNIAVFAPIIRETPLRVGVGLAFVLFVPGYALIAALLQRASTELQSGSYGTAVQASYSAVRQGLAARIGGTEALTHWEFYQAYSEAEQTDSALDALRELTEEYERAAFSGNSVTQDHAQRVLARARELCQVDDGSPSDSPQAADD